MDLEAFIRTLFLLSPDADIRQALVLIKEETVRYEMLMSAGKPTENCGTGGCGGCGV